MLLLLFPCKIQFNIYRLVSVFRMNLGWEIYLSITALMVHLFTERLCHLTEWGQPAQIPYLFAWILLAAKSCIFLMSMESKVQRSIPYTKSVRKVLNIINSMCGKMVFPKTSPVCQTALYVINQYWQNICSIPEDSILGIQTYWGKDGHHNSEVELSDLLA